MATYCIRTGLVRWRPDQRNPCPRPDTKDTQAGYYIVPARMQVQPKLYARQMSMRRGASGQPSR